MRVSGWPVDNGVFKSTFSATRITTAIAWWLYRCEEGFYWTASNIDLCPVGDMATASGSQSAPLRLPLSRGSLSLYSFFRSSLKWLLRSHLPVIELILHSTLPSSYSLPLNLPLQSASSTAHHVWASRTQRTFWFQWTQIQQREACSVVH